MIVFVAMAVGAPTNSAASLDTARGGQTALFVPFASVQYFGAKGVYFSPISPAFLTFKSTVEGVAIRYPVSGGTVESDTMLGTVDHQGGMHIQKVNPDQSQGAGLDVTEPRIFNGNVLLGNAMGVIPSPSADLINPTFSKDPVTGVIHFEADAQISALTATVLNTYLSTDAFVGGMILGRLKSDINTQGYVRPLSASPLNVSLVPAYTPCSAPNRVHGPPLEHPSCSPPVQRSTQLTVGTPDANGESPNSVGSFAMKVVPGNPLTTSEDEADVVLSVNLTDVRRKSDLADYEGELEARTTFRLTDRLNGSGLGEGTTLRDRTFEFVVPCAPTAATQTGSVCSVSTTADSIMPGIIDEGARAVWQLGQVTVTDGGTDGVAATDPNGVFAVQGVFVP